MSQIFRKDNISKVVRESVSPRFRVFHVHRSRKNRKASRRLFFVRYPAAFSPNPSILSQLFIKKSTARMRCIPGKSICRSKDMVYPDSSRICRMPFSMHSRRFLILLISCHILYCLFRSQQLSKTCRAPTRDLSMGIVRINSHLDAIFGPQRFEAFLLTNELHYWPRKIKQNPIVRGDLN